MAVLAPIPRASEAIATPVTNGVRTRVRTASFRSGMGYLAAEWVSLTPLLDSMPVENVACG